MRAKFFHLIGAVFVFGLFWTAIATIRTDSAELVCSVAPVDPTYSIAPITIDSPPVFDRTVPATDFEWDPTRFPGFSEPSLREAAKADVWRRTYRFVWDRQDAEPIVLRLELERTGGAVLHIKTGTRVDKNGRSRLVRSRTVRLNEDQVWTVLSALDERRFWGERKARLHVQCIRPIWVMEGVDTGRYGIEASSAPRDGNLRNAALVLLLYSGLRIDYVD